MTKTESCITTTATVGGGRAAAWQMPPGAAQCEGRGEGEHDEGLSQSSSVQRPLSEQRAAFYATWYKNHKRKAPAAPKFSHHHQLYLEEAGALLELPRTTTDALLPIYISLLDDLIPVIDGPRVFRHYSNGQCSPHLVRAICLAVCKTKQATPFLKLKENGPLLEPLRFGAKLLAGLDAAVKADLEPDRVTKIQILALMHLHNDGVAGMDRASTHLSRAICEAWLLSLHHPMPGNADQDQCDLLWWSLRNFDRLNKPIIATGPFMIDDADVSIARILPREHSYKSQLMGVSSALGDLMKTATRVYKANSTATVDDCLEFPLLSDIVNGTGFELFHKWHQAYLEIWYHVAAMLSCRYSGPGSVPYIRRVSSADAILHIMSHGGHDDLPPLPLVPYALAMSTTMMYRVLRDGQRDVLTTTKNMRLCYEALDSLSRRWTSARGVARLTKKLISVLSQASQAQDHVAGGIRWTGTASLSLTASGEHRDTATPAADGERLHLVQETRHARNTSPLPFIAEGGKSSQLHPQDPTEDNSFQEQLTGFWSRDGALDASYAQLDGAFQGLIDWRMPNVFRDSPTWGLLDFANDEEMRKTCDLQFQM